MNRLLATLAAALVAVSISAPGASAQPGGEDHASPHVGNAPGAPSPESGSAEPASDPVGAPETGPEAAEADSADARSPEPGNGGESGSESPGESAAESPEPRTAESAAERPLSTAEEVVRDVRAGDWRHAVAGLLVLLMLGLSKLRSKVKWFAGDRGGAALVLGLGVLGGVATALYSSSALDMKLLLNALTIAAESAGGYTVVKKLLWPSDRSEEAEAAEA